LKIINSILKKYQEGTMENLISSANDNFNPQLAYLKTLNNLSQTKNNLSQTNPQNNPQTNPQTNSNKIILNQIDDINQQWDQTTR
jgi:hypothetical protein